MRINVHKLCKNIHGTLNKFVTIELLSSHVNKFPYLKSMLKFNENRSGLFSMTVSPSKNCTFLHSRN